MPYILKDLVEFKMLQYIYNMMKLIDMFNRVIINVEFVINLSSFM